MPQLKAQIRNNFGTSSARSLRRNGLVPAVVYADGKPPHHIAVNAAELSSLAANPAFASNPVTINADKLTINALPKSIQRHPLSNFPLHADFLKVDAQSSVTVDVPVNFLNREASPGLKQGGVLNIVRHTIQVQCLLSAVPDSLEVDLINFNIGDAVHISHIALPDNVVPTISDRDFTVATIIAPRVAREDEEEEEEDKDDEELSDDDAQSKDDDAQDA